MSNDNTCPTCNREHSIHTQHCCACHALLPGYIEPDVSLVKAVANQCDGEPDISDGIYAALANEPAEILELLGG